MAIPAGVLMVIASVRFGSAVKAAKIAPAITVIIRYERIIVSFPFPFHDSGGDTRLESQKFLRASLSRSAISWEMWIGAGQLFFWDRSTTSSRSAW